MNNVRYVLLFSLVILLSLAATPVRSLSPSVGPSSKSAVSSSTNASRRSFVASAAFLLLPSNAANAASKRYILNDEGEYDEVEDPDWQTAWKERLDKAQTMSADEVFMAARGAGNLDLKEGPESDASKKRRAMAGCRDTVARQKSGVTDTKECTARVLNGDVDFMLKVL